MRCRSLGVFTSADTLVCLLTTRQREMPGRGQPLRQDGESFPARVTDSSTNPDQFVSGIIRLSESAAVPDDRLVAAERA
jgi:hypothetical protein